MTKNAYFKHLILAQKSPAFIHINESMNKKVIGGLISTKLVGVIDML